MTCCLLQNLRQLPSLLPTSILTNDSLVKFIIAAKMKLRETVEAAPTTSVLRISPMFARALPKARQVAYNNGGLKGSTRGLD
jgi:hypothetical protein